MRCRCICNCACVFRAKVFDTHKQSLLIHTQTHFHFSQNVGYKSRLRTKDIINYIPSFLFFILFFLFFRPRRLSVCVCVSLVGVCNLVCYCCCFCCCRFTLVSIFCRRPSTARRVIIILAVYFLLLCKLNSISLFMCLHTCST